VTIQNGGGQAFGGGIKVGGGSNLSLMNVTLTNNTATTQGGALFNAGTATLNNTIVRNNTVSGPANTFGGGIYNLKTLTLNGVTVQDNSAAGGTAGGVANTPTGNMVLSNVTLRRNTAKFGGGSLSAGTSVLDRVTVSDNVATVAEAGFANGGASALSNFVARRNSSANFNGGLGNGGF